MSLFDVYRPERGLYEGQLDCVIVIPLQLLKNAVDCVELGWDEWEFECGHDERFVAAGYIEPTRMLRMRPLLSIRSWWQDKRFPYCLSCLSTVNA